MPENSACFTGHRPKKFPFGYDERAAGCLSVKAMLAAAIDIAVAEHGIAEFISGMALGVDTWAAEAVVEARSGRHPGIRLVAAVPCQGQDSQWPASSRRRHEGLLLAADEVVVVTEAPYSPSAMAIRDRWMVDRSRLLIAVFDGTAGGTKHTYDYAVRRNLGILRILPPATAEGEALFAPEPEVPQEPEGMPTLF